MQDDSLTVLMTVYNGGPYLAEAVRSVISQDFKNYEFLIIDDASTDDSVRTVKSFHDPRIRLIRNPKNIGQTASLNIGLREARGEYVARIDADDLALPGWLAAQAAGARQHPACAVISLPIVQIDLAGKVQKSHDIFTSREDIFLRILTHSPVNHGGCLMKRSLILAEGGYDEKLRIAADYALWSRLFCHGHSFFFTAHTGMAIRVHGGSLSRASLERLKAEVTPIMAANILALTDHALSEEELEMLWGIFYDIDAFPRARVRAAEEAFRKVIFSRKPAAGVTDAMCRNYFNAIRRQNALRLLFRAMDRNVILKSIPLLARRLLQARTAFKFKARA